MNTLTVVVFAVLTLAAGFFSLAAYVSPVYKKRLALLAALCATGIAAIQPWNLPT